MFDAVQNESWGIYVHVPWCRRRCVYCDFYFEVGKTQGGFAERILRQWQARRSRWPEQPAVSLYFGGGTPSLLDCGQIRQIVAHIKASGSLTPHAEVTLEANPEDICFALLKHWQQAGVTRLSLGVQSLQQDVLRFLGRKHTSLQAKQAIQWALQLHFRVSVDWIVGVPGQSIDACRQDVLWAAQQGVQHVSVYLLTVEPNTALQRLMQKGRYPPVNADEQADVYQAIQHWLTHTAGYQQYEVSSYCKPSYESVHNRLHWAGGQYLGLGPAAHSMLLQPNGAVWRQHTRATLKQWWRDPVHPPSVEETLSPPQALRESLAFGIRDLQRGIDPAALSKRHCTFLPHALHNVLQQHQQQGWLQSRNTRWHLTQQGALFADAVARELLAL
ncbi:MAG: radical SAM family heme chaperone HemW [Myxococcota bacterium]